ncbi:pilus assembly protein TadG-related protein [Streptomyces sp. MS06]|uniref:pilus assembly protein TadG-related protein n=1 Tax=Streptomyces sp. MS06 TaxID=3385974 RepID=UPI00399F4E62
MIRSTESADSGQAFPIYLTVVGGLLLLAFAYLAVGQAAVNRSQAQGAADAAALAAAQETRDQLADQWAQNVRDPEKWQAIFDGDAEVVPSCWRAYQLAQQNDARVTGCSPAGPLAYRVDVTTNKSVGRSVIPNTESRHASASAMAVIEPRCTFALPDEEASDEALPQLSCKGKTWRLDTDELTVLPQPKDLFDVHLADE